MTSKASGRVLYLNPMDYGTNPGVDAIAHGLHHRLETSGLELRVVFNDFSRADWRERAASTIDAAIAAKFRAVVIYVLDPMEPAAAVARARKAGLQVFSFERPRFPVDGSLVYPNFNQGTYMAEHLADRVLQALVRIRDDELHAGEAALDQAAEEVSPERLCLALAAVEADHLAPT